MYQYYYFSMQTIFIKFANNILKNLGEATAPGLCKYVRGIIKIKKLSKCRWWKKVHRSFGPRTG